MQLLESPHLNHRVEVRAGVLAEEAAALLKRYFTLKREAERAERALPQD
jgi:tRNA(Arg) A34 adenosine deaminase TadA